MCGGGACNSLQLRESSCACSSILKALELWSLPQRLWLSDMQHRFTQSGAACSSSSALPSVFTRVLSMLLLLQLLVSLIVPRNSSTPDFTVISISRHDSGSLDSSVDGRSDSATELWPNEETAARVRAYADENELSSRQVNTAESLTTQDVPE